MMSLKKWVLERIYWQEAEFKPIYKIVDKIPGWLISPVEEYCLYKLARRLPPKAIVVEIGSYKGRSTCCLGFGCVGRHGHVYAIDIFDEDKLKDFKANVEYCRLQDTITPIVGRSEEVAPKWTFPIDCIFIDGCHDYLKVLEDFNDYFPLVVSGGIVALHDVSNSWDGPRLAWSKHVEPKLKDIGAAMSIRYGVKL